MEFEPLYPPGFHDLRMDQLEDMFVNPFEANDRRKELLQRFNALYALLCRLGINLEIWLDGSFSTHKPDPGDIDLAIFFDPSDLAVVNLEQRKIIATLQDNSLCKIRYECDVYFMPNNNKNNRSYWRGWFGFSRNELPKGIPRIIHHAVS